ncbi:putative glycoside hydrolase family 1, glycoside hydrolase superfamily [Septoria linicola]|nr:putative glycoside hydrolase family 1, glycoside hydrolase superfamily [Septoria linicola]
MASMVKELMRDYGHRSDTTRLFRSQQQSRPLLSHQADACLDCCRFPKDFIWGVAGSAWQIEGGLTEDGRGPSLLDQIGALGVTAGAGDANAEVTDMNYYLYKQDIARLAAIGVPYYSFSIAWTRIVPFGIAGSPINQAGLDHYDDLLNTCLEYGIQPIVTLTHADPPLNHSYNAPDFADSFLYYAKEVMTRYSDRVSHWVTLNEPNIAYPGFANYSAVPNILTAHASAYHWYKEELEGTGLVTIKFANNLATPLDNGSQDDMRSALRYQDFIVGILGNPIFLGEQIPEEVLNTPGLNLTALTTEELAYINGTSDFWSFDPYTAGFATSPPGGIDACAQNQSDPLWPTCVVNTNVQTDGWLNGRGSYAYAYIAPQYVRQQLGYVWNTFKPSGILIAEFGFNPFMESAKTTVAQLYDLERTYYYQAFLRETLKAVYQDNVNVIGALAWSFVDNDEFGSYDQQYGLQHVNRTNGEFTRSFKRSFFDYVDFFHKFVEA